MKHSEPHPLAGQTIQTTDGDEYRVEDWWDRVSGGSWMNATGNPAALAYAMRNALVGLPVDDEVVYGKVGNLGHIAHISELVLVSA